MIEALAALIVGVGTVLGILVGRLYGDLAGLRAENRRLWLWARSLVDYAYRYRRTDAPELPALPKLDDD